MNATYGRIRELRLAKNLNAEKVAREVGISYQCYMIYEREVHTPSVKQLKRIAEYFHVSMAYLLGYDDQPATMPDLDLSFYEVFLKMSDEQKKNLFKKVLEKEREYEAEKNKAAQKKTRGVLEYEYLKISPLKERLEPGKCSFLHKYQ
ncbi:MAG: helix-turn-helix transcriptional regulator [Clostridia bacterium]|nr:helix-turn-helix transcriptional regulator [Clostridia bacterium]